MRQYLLCRWHDEAFALPTDEVLELLRMVAVTRLPSEAGRIDGLINYRGEMIPVLDSSRLFQRPAIAYDTDSLLAVIRHEGQAMAVAAHELIELRDAGEDQIKIYDSSGQEPFHAALKLDDRLYPILNLGRLQQDAHTSLQQLAQTI